MVTADIYRSVDGVQRALENMDVKVLAPAALIFAGGAFVAQEAQDLVFPRLGLSADPADATGLGAAFVFKMVLAIALVGAGTRFGGPAVAGLATTLAVGVLTLSGADVIDMVQRGGLPGMSPAGMASAASGAVSSTSRSTSTTSTASTPAKTRTATTASSGGSSGRSYR